MGEASANYFELTGLLVALVATVVIALAKLLLLLLLAQHLPIHTSLLPRPGLGCFHSDIHIDLAIFRIGTPKGFPIKFQGKPSRYDVDALPMVKVCVQKISLKPKVLHHFSAPFGPASH